MRLGALAGAAALSAAVFGPAAGQVQCERDIVAKLNELGVERAAVTSLYTHVNRTTEGYYTSNGLTGWVRLASCRGGLVLNMSSSCAIYEAYSRGDCRLPGIRSH
jgi:hypothetical protein